MSKKAFWVLTENSSKCLVNLWIVNKVEEGILTENSSKRLEVFFCKDKQRQSWRRRFDRKLTTYLTILNDGDFSWYEEIEMGCGLARLRHSTKLFLSHVLLSSDLWMSLTFVKPFSFVWTAVWQCWVQTSKHFLWRTMDRNGVDLAYKPYDFIEFTQS